MREVFRDVDVVLAPTTPFPAPPNRRAAHDNCGGRRGSDAGAPGPVISAPIAGPGPLPLGVQLVAAPFMEATLFRVAARLEQDGVVAAPLASARA